VFKLIYVPASVVFRVQLHPKFWDGVQSLQGAARGTRGRKQAK